MTTVLTQQPSTAVVGFRSRGLFAARKSDGGGPSTPLYVQTAVLYETIGGEFVRSKSEWIIAALLDKAGIKYSYEHPLFINGIRYWPDFTIHDEESGAVWYWEHAGMLSDNDYRRRWNTKLLAYRAGGIVRASAQLGGRLLVTEEDCGRALDIAAIRSNIELILAAREPPSQAFNRTDMRHCTVSGNHLSKVVRNDGREAGRDRVIGFRRRVSGAS